MKIMYGQGLQSKTMATMLNMDEWPILRFVGLAVGQYFIGVCWRGRK